MFPPYVTIFGAVIMLKMKIMIHLNSPEYPITILRYIWNIAKHTWWPVFLMHISGVLMFY